MNSHCFLTRIPNRVTDELAGLVSKNYLLIIKNLTTNEIKPGNIIIIKEEVVLLTDLPIRRPTAAEAEAAEAEAGITGPGKAAIDCLLTDFDGLHHAYHLSAHHA